MKSKKDEAKSRSHGRNSKRRGWMRVVVLALAVLAAMPAVEAQPGGPGGPGGRPPMGQGGGRPGGRRPPMGGDWNQQTDDQKASTVKQKKKVKEGDTFKVVGSLRDSVSGEFLAFVNVAVLDSADSSFVKGASTNFDGLFEIADVPQGAYLLRISAIGYQNRMVPFRVENNTALGTLRMKPGATTLDAVEITAEKPLYAMDGEKLVYNVEDDPSIQTGTTEDALQNAPGVEVDVEGNVSLRGVSSVEIWINDKPSKLTEENLKTYLQTLPANALARIETITNPSAKYATDAEAVINIVTSAHIKSNQFVSFGINGSNQPFVSPWVSYMWAKERLSINLFASGRYSSRDNTNEGWSLRRQDHPGGILGEDYDTTLYQTDNSDSRNNSFSGNLFANINYEIDSTSDLSVDAGGVYNYNHATSGRATEQFFFLPTPDTNIYSITDTNTSPSWFAHAGTDYTKKFDQHGHNLRLGVNTRFNRNAGEEYYNRTYTTYSLPGDEHRYMKTDNYGYGFDLDARYNRPYSEDGELSYGLRAGHSVTDNEFRRFYSTDGGVSYDSVDALRTYTFNGQNSNVNADVNWTHRWGLFTLSSGLGYGLERVAYNYGENPNADDSVFFNHSFRPSIHLTYRTEDMHNFKLNYSMRMSNPSAGQVSTFRSYGEDSYSTGNPRGLDPSFTHSFEGGWQKYFENFGNVGVELYGRLSSNEISSLTDAEYDSILERVVSFSMPYNMGSSWRYGASLNMTYRPTGFFNVRLYANIYDYGYHLDDYRGQDFTKDKWSWSVRVNAWAKVWNQYQLTASFNYTSPTLSLMSERKARFNFNLGARSDFFKRKLSVFVNIQDLFNWGGRYGSGSDNTNPYYLSSNTNKMTNSRYISAGITLRFGKMELEKGAKDGSTEEGDSL
ncbi:MAG: TonB-dependent receptor [Bacteroidales bacterium]|nr:TonB-dependent receptor [Bacteroidales bacterium]